MWPFKKKSKISGLPQKLPFKSGAAFLEYQCEFGHVDIVPKQGIVALVMDSSKEFGTENPVKVESDGTQKATLKVASNDGGFIVIAQTPSGKGDPLKPDDVVIWVPMLHSKEVVPDGHDQRFGWAGFIVAKVKPEIDMANPNFEILSRYD
ncbi:hypothetical protein ROE7235_03617 [Roseibaca ekhonensis]|uniref:Uncharacterized protein n=1 Tax=Roseinatronobacter ekhonensis TaxID=254356 RepID=A0A3B0MDG0_9RHOB|nr:hypothetical protein [Roseibaca ekhonensis]SUZ33842.1 hypothetical protein ROE7235_03617 [Roseibaca ekhonensis]